MPQIFHGSTICSVCLLIVGGLLPAESSHGQATFLERLEAKVREQISQPGPQNVVPSAEPSTDGSEEELPSPSGTQRLPANSIPANTLPSVLEQPADARDAVTGDASASGSGRIYLGLEAEEVTGGGIGVRVTRVTQDSPAWKGGFRNGDRVSAINGFAIANLDAMVEQLGKAKPGQAVKFLVNRDNRNLELVAVLMDADLAERIARGPLPIGQLGEPQVGGLPPNAIPGGAPPVPEPNSTPVPADIVPPVAGAPGGGAWLGVAVSDLTPDFRRQFGIAVFRGAAVTSVSPNSPAAKAGIQAGDAVVSMAQVPIESARDLTAAVSASQAGQTVDITFQRGSISRTAQLTMELPPGSRSAPIVNRAPSSNRGGVAAQADARPPANSLPPPVPTPDVGLAAGALADGSLDLNPPTVSDSSQQVAELQREVARLRSELQQATERLESTQNRLQQIIDGLGNQ